MKKLKINILKDKSLRVRLIKAEIFYKISKSLVQNNNIDLLKKNYFFFFLKKNTTGRIKSSRKKNTCIVTGSRHSVIGKFGVCRQQIKRLIISNKVDNIKIFI